MSCTNLSAKIEHTHTESLMEAKYFFGMTFKSGNTTFVWDPEVRDKPGGP